MITQRKTTSKDGYNSVQLGYGAVHNKKLNKPLLGHLKSSSAPPVKYLAEFRLDENDPNNFQQGEIISIDIFSIGENVNVSGNRIGKGFTSNRKRHNFARGPMTHGSKNHRAPGSIGAGTTPGRVIPGKKMSGRLGASRTTIKNLKIVDLNSDKNLILVKGAIPGKTGNLVSISSSK